MNQVFKIKKPVRVVTFLLISVIIWGIGAASAGEAGEISAITPVPEIAPDGSSVPGYVIQGEINRIDKHGVVVGDSFRPFSSSVLFLSGNKKPISSTKFTVGTKAGIRMNSKNEVISMWILKDYD